MNISLLDCTLRDGCHITSGKFGYNQILDISGRLSMANVNIVEMGFLKDIDKYEKDSTFFPNIEDAYTVISEIKHKKGTKYALMVRADQYDINSLPVSNGRIKLLRIAFYYDYLEKAIDCGKIAMEKGYEVSFNLINTPGNSMMELKHFINCVNEVNSFAVSIVDTFGVLDSNDLKRIVELYDSELNKDIKIGLHVHENLSASYALAETFLRLVSDAREVIIDSSLTGIGRAPGNFCTEIASNFLNKTYGTNYDVHSILEIAENNILPFKKNLKWGYSPEYFVSAIHKVHRSYAEVLHDKGIGIDVIDNIAGQIDEIHAKKYDSAYLDMLIKKNGLLV
jgi:4-hydroxy 2-oxovalerate aldolase